MIIIGFFRQSHHFAGAHVLKEEQHPGVANFCAMCFADGIIDVPHFCAEIQILVGFLDVFKAHQPFEPDIIFIDVRVVIHDVGRYSIQGNRLACLIIIVFYERAIRSVLADQSAHFIGSQFESQIFNLILIQCFFGVIHDAGIVPVEHRIGFLGRIVIGALDTIVINQFLHGLVGIRRPFSRGQDLSGRADNRNVRDHEHRDDQHGYETFFALEVEHLSDHSFFRFFGQIVERWQHILSADYC